MVDSVDDVRVGRSRSTTISPTTGSRPRSSWRCGCTARCCSRARRASARPRWPRCSRAGPAASSCGSSATRASTPPRPSTSGTTRASCCTCGRSRPSGGEVVEDELYSERFLVRRPLLRAIVRRRRRSAAGAARRRGRPRRRRVRGVPARDPLRLVDHRARAGHVPRRGAADRGAHVEPHARRARRVEAPLPVPLDRAPRLRTRARDRAVRAPEVSERARPSGRGARSRRCAGSSSTSRRASRRRSTGRRRSRALGRRALDEHSVDVDPRHHPQVPRGSGARRARTASTSSCTPRWSGVPDQAVDLEPGGSSGRRSRLRPAPPRRRPRRARREHRSFAQALAAVGTQPPCYSLRSPQPSSDCSRETMKQHSIVVGLIVLG